MKGSKIGRRILRYMLIAALGMGTLVFTVAFLEMTRMYDSAVSSSQELGAMASAESSQALLDQAEAMLGTMATGEAEKDDQVFRGVEQKLSMIANMLEDIDSAPDVPASSIPPRPEETGTDVLMGRGAIAQSVTVTQDILNEQALMATVSSGAAGFYKQEPLVRAVLIGTQTGIFYRYSDYNDYDPDYDARTRIWYTQALDTPDAPVWTDAYYDQYGVYLATCSMTFRGADGQVAGVIAADISIGDMTDQMLTQSEDGSFAFLIDRSGTPIAIPDGYTDRALNDPARDATLASISSATSGVLTVGEGAGRTYIAYAHLDTIGWTFGIVVPYSQVTASSDAAMAAIGERAEKASNRLQSLMEETRVQYSLIFLLCGAAVCYLAYSLAEKIRRPVSHLTAGVKRMGSGELDERLKVKGDDELADLGHAFNKMADDLQHYIADLSRVMEEKHRAQAELNVATQIQEDMLPKLFPAFPDRKEFDIYATMTPAREVGGDFYDFFMLDDHRLALVIADVSGKGVPAALFMVVSKTLIKNQAQSSASPAEIL